jgi:prepilin-type N-terminal cleavage/methylation domain-containing protein
MNRSGFTMVEIVVSMVLLVAVSAVAFTSFTSSTKTTQATPDNIAYNVARGVLDQLYEYVRADQWATAGQRLNPNAPGPAFANQTLNGVTFTPTYTVASKDADGAGSTDDYRRVDVTVTW